MIGLRIIPHICRWSGQTGYTVHARYSRSVAYVMVDHPHRTYPAGYRVHPRDGATA